MKIGPLSNRFNLSAVLVAVILSTSACNGGENPGGDAGMKTTMTQAQANQAVDKHIQDAISRIPDAKYKERIRFEDNPCTDPDDHGAKGRINAQRDYEITEIEPAKIPQYFETLRRWWSSNGFRILDNTKPYEYLWVENNADAVRIALQASEGHLFIKASSPCVWKNGTPNS